MPFPGCPEYPSRTIKQGKDGVKDKEKNVQEGIPHAKLVETIAISLFGPAGDLFV
jgi:hypothetical protein